MSSIRMCVCVCVNVMQLLFYMLCNYVNIWDVIKRNWNFTCYVLLHYADVEKEGVRRHMQTKEPENEGTGHQIPIRRTNRRELLLLRRRPPLLILKKH